MTTYEIQTRDQHIGWTNDASLLGHGFTDNTWTSEADAQAAIGELVAIGFDADRLRVAAING